MTHKIVLISAFWLGSLLCLQKNDRLGKTKEGQCGSLIKSGRGGKVEPNNEESVDTFNPAEGARVTW